MPLNKLDNFIKNTEGRILYVSPSDLDSTDSISNQGNSLAQPFKTLQRALIESARFSYLEGNSNDAIEKTTILLMPGEHIIDNRPGFALKNVGGTAKVYSPGGAETAASDTLNLKLDSNFDVGEADNILYKFNSVYGGIIVPRGTSVVGLDLRKTKLRPKYVPNPTDPSVAESAIFRITGGCYFWQFSMFDGDTNSIVYTDSADFSVDNQSKPLFSHHKLTCFEYADGVNNVGNYDLTDLDMYYAKLSNAYNNASGRDIESTDKYPANPEGFEKQRAEWEIVGAFASDPISISTIEAGTLGTPSSVVTVVTSTEHKLNEGTPIKIKGVSPVDYNISTRVQSVGSTTQFTYLLPTFRNNLTTPGNASGATVTVETDTVDGSSPYIFNCSLRSVYGMQGMHADGNKSSGFRSMVVAQFTGVSLQKDDRSFVKYNKTNRSYEGLSTAKVTSSTLSSNSSSTNPSTIYHLDSGAVYRNGWETAHIRITNDAILQIVSVFAIGYNRHFSTNSGGDASITNSNSNFGQLSLTSTGFKKEAFAKDNKAYVTNIIAPRAITTDEENIDWQRIDVGVTTSVANNRRLYLNGFTNEDIKPPILTQGYRVGAKLQDKLYVDFSGISGYGTSEAQILMTDNATSSVKEYVVISGPTSNKFSINAHTLSTGEKVIVNSDDGDLPENIDGETVYYVIDVGNNNQIQLAASKSDAEDYASTGEGAISVYGGTNLRILSRISDKVSGDIGHPVQWDSTNNQWYINTAADNDVYTAITQVGVRTAFGLDSSTEPAFIKRKTDSRSLDEKIYKLRVVIPKELSNAKNPESGFIIQESSSTGVRTDGDFTLDTLTTSDYDFNRNPRFIGSCTYSGGTVSVRTELPHNLDAGDQVIIKNVTDTTNTVGTANSGYNGTWAVASVSNDMEFTYTTGRSLGPALTNDLTSRTTSLPRFERNDLQSNLYVYRNEIINEYVEGQQDGIYHIYCLNADVGVTTEFTSLEYSQNVVDLYPQLDRDNNDDSPWSAKSFAKRAPLGEVTTSDLKKSITKASTDSFLKKFENDMVVSSESVLSGVTTLTFTKNHGLSGISTISSSNITGGSGHTNGTYYNTKLFNEVGLSSWNGATAVVGVQGGAVVSVDVQSPGSGYQDGDVLYVDTAVIGGSANATVELANDGLTGSIIQCQGSAELDGGGVVQVTGIGTTAGGYFRATSVPSKNQIAIAKTAGDPFILAGQYVIPIGPVGEVSSATYTASTGIQNVTCAYAHGLVAGNRFTFTDASNNKIGDYLVKSRVGVNTFTVVTNTDLFAGSDDPVWILKHGLSANDGISDKSDENIGARGVALYDNEVFKIVGFNGDTKIQVASPTQNIVTTSRFPIGSYLQVGDEIMRIAGNSLTGVSSNELTVLRGALATGIQTHEVGSFVRKINPVAVEFRRPSIIRASGHTFEYLGYGPGNYSTGLPQVQDRTLTEREEFLSQSQERSCGIVVYTGMNNKGDFYIGNRKRSSATGEEVTFDTPIPTVTGEDPSRLSVVYDEVTIKERLVVEGGDSNQILSQFDGPVTFSKEIIAKDKVTLKNQLKIIDTTDSTSKTTGALVVSGGVGIGSNLSVGGNVSFGSSAYFGDNEHLYFGDGNDLDVYHDGSNSYIKESGTGSLLIAKSDGTEIAKFDAGIGVTITGTLTGAAATFYNGTFGNIQIAVNDDSGTDKIDTKSGNLILDSADGRVRIFDNCDITGECDITGQLDVFSTTDSTSKTTGAFTVAGGAGIKLDLNVGGDITAFASSDERLKDNITPIEDPLAKVLSISGNTFNWNEASKWEGKADTGVIAQEIEALGLPGLTDVREDGTHAVRYEKLTALLIEAIKELSTKVEILEQKLQDK